MFLRNFDNMLTQIAMPHVVRKVAGSEAGGWGDEDHQNIKLLHYDGTMKLLDSISSVNSSTSYFNVHPLYALTPHAPYCGSTTSYYDTYFVVGQGKEEGSEEKVSYNDYKLNTPYKSGDVDFTGVITSEAESVKYSTEEDSWTYSVSLLGVAKKDLSIGEIGLMRDNALFYKEFFEVKIPVPKDANFRMTFTAKIYAHPNKPIEDPKVEVTVE